MIVVSHVISKLISNVMFKIDKMSKFTICTYIEFTAQHQFVES